MGRLAIRLLLTTYFIAVVPPAAQAQSLELAFDVIQNAVTDGDIPGALVRVVHDGNTVTRAFGLCDREGERAFQNDTICWIASLTKPITAAAAMTLVERGKLDLAASVDQYLPEFRHLTTLDGRYLPVTVRQLMCHASGIQSSVPMRPRYFFDQSWFQRSLPEIAPLIAKTHLEFDPGTKVQYSNAAPYVLGRIIEVQSGQSFSDYVQANILKPLDMHDTGFTVAPQHIERTAVVYRKEDDTSVEYCRYDPNWQVHMCMPDGGLFSTTRDIAKFAAAFLEGGKPIISEMSVREMLKPQSAGYGLGWILDQPGQFSHWGSSGTLVWGDLQTNTVGVVFIQLQDLTKVADIHQRFRQAVTRATAGS